jgi:hypothetical protein
MRNISLDVIGIFSSVLCMIHCVSTPFLFIAKTYSVSSCAVAPLWWQLIDYLFLIISFFAVYSVSKNSSVKWLKTSFWITWVVLLLVILNHTFDLFHLHSSLIYIPAFVIVTLHFYNFKYCKC